MTIGKDTRVGVLMGGLSTERKVSLKSGHAVAQALRERGWDVVEVDVGRDLPARLVADGVGAAWIALHGRFGEDGCVQGLLEVMGIPYTGCGVRASAVAMDKIATKRAVADVAGVRMARDLVVTEPGGAPPFLPCVVKPAVGGSTIGIAIARTEGEYTAAIEGALALDPYVLVEEMIVGEEITVAVLDGEALPVVRIVPKSGFFDYEAKYTAGQTEYEVPGAIPDDQARSAQRAAEAVYRAIGCRGLCRADFMVPASGDPVFLEINTIPGMTATSLSPMAAGATGVSFGELCERLLVGATCMRADD
ncbi:MAG: D-alanine--D-alanine ligase [Alphaproteobacteria bacterium]|nr:D-alanine--D-alanine ligase [Alphaproteobacteria bacterium]